MSCMLNAFCCSVGMVETNPSCTPCLPPSPPPPTSARQPAYDGRLCGRGRIFISRCNEHNDKSGLNVLVRDWDVWLEGSEHQG